MSDSCHALRSLSNDLMSIAYERTKDGIPDYFFSPYYVVMQVSSRAWGIERQASMDEQCVFIVGMNKITMSPLNQTIPKKRESFLCKQVFTNHWDIYRVERNREPSLGPPQALKQNFFMKPFVGYSQGSHVSKFSPTQSSRWSDQDWTSHFRHLVIILWGVKYGEKVVDPIFARPLIM